MKLIIKGILILTMIFIFISYVYHKKDVQENFAIDDALKGLIKEAIGVTTMPTINNLNTQYSIIKDANSKVMSKVKNIKATVGKEINKWDNKVNNKLKVWDETLKNKMHSMDEMVNDKLYSLTEEMNTRVRDINKNMSSQEEAISGINDQITAESEAARKNLDKSFDPSQFK